MAVCAVGARPKRRCDHGKRPEVAAGGLHKRRSRGVLPGHTVLDRRIRPSLATRSFAAGRATARGSGASRADIALDRSRYVAARSRAAESSRSAIKPVPPNSAHHPVRWGRFSPFHQPGIGVGTFLPCRDAAIGGLRRPYDRGSTAGADWGPRPSEVPCGPAPNRPGEARPLPRARGPKFHGRLSGTG